MVIKRYHTHIINPKRFRHIVITGTAYLLIKFSAPFHCKWLDFITILLSCFNICICILLAGYCINFFKFAIILTSINNISFIFI